MSNVEKFCEARQYLVETIDPYIETFLCGIWDPCIKFTLSRDTTKIIDDDLTQRFNEIPKKYLPKVKFRLHDSEELTEVSIQHYFNTDASLTYLGSVGIGAELFDLYYRESFDPNFQYMFVAKYGHGFDDYYSGSKTAKAEYYLGAATPLAVAYSFAMDDGII